MKKTYRKLLKGLAKLTELQTLKDSQNIAGLLKTITRAKGHANLKGEQNKIKIRLQIKKVKIPLCHTSK